MQANDTPAPDAPTPETSDPEPAEGSTSFFQMFFVPLVIAGVLTGVITFFGLVGRDDKSVAQHLKDIRYGNQHQRWQSAFELAYHLQEKGKDAVVSEEDRTAALAVFEESARDPDPRIREYMALTLGQLRCREAVPALTGALQDASDGTRVYAIMSLGAIGEPASEVPVARMLEHQDPGTRKAAAFALGGLPGTAARAGLQKALQDPVADVTWNAALSLARLGDDSGRALLLTMLDRQRLSATPEILPAQVADVLSSAARATGALKIAEAAPLLTTLAKTDPDHKVREAARASLEALGAPLAGP